MFLTFYCPDRPLYIEIMALGAMLSLSMLEHVQSTHRIAGAAKDCNPLLLELFGLARRIQRRLLNMLAFS
jgi:hypothetical protein